MLNFVCRIVSKTPYYFLKNLNVIISGLEDHLEVEFSEGIASEVEIASVSTTEEASEDDTVKEERKLSKETQCNLFPAFPAFQPWKISAFSEQPQAIQYYTGFCNFEHFKFFLDCLEGTGLAVCSLTAT